jgi:catechol 2,3-dioxygenase-like lactoylglutathione lyase family enzyme
MNARLDHIAIFVRKLEEGMAFYRDVVGLGEPIVREIPELLIRCAFFDPGAGGVIVELVEFSGKGDLAHGDVVVAIEVDDLDAALAHFHANGVRAFDQPSTPNLPLRRGWVLKADGHGTVIELCPRGAVARFVRGDAPASAAHPSAKA